MLCLLYLSASAPASAQEPFVPNEPFPEDDVMQVIAHIDKEDGAPRSHSSVTIHQGHMVQVYANSGSNPNSGIAFFDISDPYNPIKVAGTESGAGKLSEQHAVAYSNGYGGVHVALLAVGGIQIWDWSDIREPRQVSYLELPGVTTGYAKGAWWLSWQAPFLYVGGASNGLFVINTLDIERPRLVRRTVGLNPMPNNQTGGFRIGPVFAIGNLLVISSNDGRGYATLDISDPRNPTLLASRNNDSPPSYSTMVNAGLIYAAGTDDRLHVLDIRNPNTIELLDSVKTFGRGGYLTLQDGFVHMGASEHYVKVDVRDEDEYRVVNTASSKISNRDEDFAVVLGNLIALSDDHGYGTFLIPHQAEPDNVGPSVNMVNPAPLAENQNRTTRVGLTFSDQIDLRSVTTENIIVRPIGGETLAGKFSLQTGIVNFAPDDPLMPNTTYEVVVPTGGVRDVVGNPNPTAFRSTFSTGVHIDAPVHCRILPVAAAEVGKWVDFEVKVESSVGEVDFSWSLGDGSEPTIPLDSPRFRYKYEIPGHHIVRVIAANDSFTTACSTQVTVHHRIVPGRPASSSTIIFDPDRSMIWNVNPDNNSVSATNAVDHELLFEAPVGRTPRTLAQAPDGNIWVVNQSDYSVSILEPEGGALVGEIPLPYASEPYAIIFAPDRSAAFVTLQAVGQVAKLDVSSQQVAGLIDVGPTPRGLAASHADGRLFVTRYISPQDHGVVTEIDGQALTVLHTFELAVDPGPDNEDSGRGLPNGLGSPTLSPDGLRLWIPSMKDNIGRGLLHDGQPLTFESTVRPILSQIDLTANAEELESRLDINDREAPVAVRFSPLGDYVFVVLQGSNAVDIFDVFSRRLVTSIQDVGIGPQGLDFTSDGTKLFVHGQLSRSVSIYDVKDIIEPGRDQRPDLLETVKVVEEDRMAEEVRLGKQIFFSAADRRINRDGYIACSSCHLDGGHDGRVWDRTANGEGLRNTIDLRFVENPEAGGRLHWTANFDEIQDFEHDMRDLFGGLGFIDDALYHTNFQDQPLGTPKAGLSLELDALAAYVHSLAAADSTGDRSPHRKPNGALTADGLAGREVFLQLGCAVCHGGPEFTDSALGLLHDVGTLTPESGRRAGQTLLGIDTPSLRGLWASAPYLHDGSASTLLGVLGVAGPDNPHGYTQPLSGEERFQLRAYLRQIDRFEAEAPAPIPAIELLAPKPDTQISAGQDVRIIAATTSILGPVTQVEFFADGMSIGVDRTPIYTWMWENAPVGEHELRARLHYAGGTKTLSAPIIVSVLP